MEIPAWLILSLAILLSIRWGIKLYHTHESGNIFTLAAYLYFVIIYIYITFFVTSQSDTRPLVRIGLTVVFLDEIINWLTPPFLKFITRLGKGQ